MKRNITKELVKWKDQNNRKPLIIRGARQVGKSWVIIDFGQNHFEGNLHLVNLEKQLDWHSIFELNLDANRIVTELEILLNTDIVTGKDIIFFDEIQSCPKAIAALRYFYEQLPNLHVIAAGSLLEFALQDIPFPVGRVQIMNMFPMCFTEYLQAVGKERLVKNMVQNTKGQSDTIHNLIRAELRNYF
ncbi:MAG: AAA family ATPase, partial [Bacteroidota bacterium]